MYQVGALYQQCIKLATENKITSKNTWALGLIDHLHDLVQPNAQEGSTTNFQRASVTLGAGVEIYSKRVDSVHTEAFKVLGGLGRGNANAPESNENGELWLGMLAPSDVLLLPAGAQAVCKNKA